MSLIKCSSGENQLNNFTHSKMNIKSTLQLVGGG